MFAIIETLGRQYKVAVGDRIKVDRISSPDAKEGKVDVPAGAKVIFDRVLMVGDAENAKVGAPVVPASTVVATVIEQGKDKKGVAFKKKRRKGYTRKVGYRRAFTVVEIQEIKAA